MNNIIFSNDVEHARFRKALAPAFSEQSLRLQEDLIKGYVDMLIATLREEADKEQNVDMTMWYNLTTFDISKYSLPRVKPTALTQFEYPTLHSENHRTA